MRTNTIIIGAPLGAFLLLVLISYILETARAQVSTFHPLASVNARTIKKGTLALGRAPLGNLNSSFLTSSLNYGLFKRLEIGTAPVFYIIPEHKYNFLIKLNFYRGDDFDWGLIVGNTVFRTEVNLDGEKEKPDLEMTSLQLALNYHPNGSKWEFGFSGTNSCGSIKSKNPLVRAISLVKWS
jgi:hypothetical protein